MKVLIALIIAAFMLGCAQLLKIQGQAAEKAAQAIEQYCANTDEAFRAKFRADVNAKLVERGSGARLPDQGICGSGG